MKSSVLLFFCCTLFLAIFSGCETKNENFQEDASDPAFMHRSMKKLTDVIVYDIFSPPVASRVYAYPSIAAFEAAIPNNPDFVSLANQLDGLTPAPAPEEGKEYCYPLASVHAFLVVGKALVFSESKVDEFITQIHQEFKEIGVPGSVFDRSVAYGDAVAAHVLNWADKDNYKQTRTFPKYTVRQEAEAWKPTPPDYMEGIEPHWNKIRTFVLDSSSQFVPPPPTPYDMDKNSQFYKELMEVYEVGKNLSTEQEAIAQFWDCNPYVSHHTGHVMFATKKITPGGHWIGITAIATKQNNTNFIETTEAYAKVSVSLADAFISCWDEKWRSILVRPETVINNHIDDEWTPLLQTPPFPEYTSGHSVISASAATMLTSLFGETFQFVDTTEVEYGLPPRTFDSFFDASEEAAISRLYGGIHYMPACRLGVDQGKLVGNLIVSRLQTRKQPVSIRKED